MDDTTDATNLDKEFKKYLQLLKSYLGHLVDEDLINICNAWIQRLSNCNEDEKVLRNKYLFLLCYQIARGALDTPFLNNPPLQLQILPDDVNSDDDSSEVEYVVINSNSNESKVKVLFDTKKVIASETAYLSKVASKMWGADSEISLMIDESESLHKQELLSYQCPNIIRCDDHPNKRTTEEYEFRAHNLVKKLRSIKMQNILLQKELTALKDVTITHNDFSEDYITKVDNMTSTFVYNNDNNEMLKSLRCQLQEIQDSRNVLIDKISHLQNELDNFNELKKNEIENIEAKHKLSLVKAKTDTEEELKYYYDKKLDDLKKNYEETFKNIQETANEDIKNIQETNDKIICEKNIALEAKNKEINDLKNQIGVQNINMHSLLNKLIDKTIADTSKEELKIQNQLLEKRLNKMEKTKIKCTKMYEARLSQLKREKHLAECSLQLQLVRQRAQVVSKLTEENQIELNTSLERLENKYKDIVANVQATAIQRRVRDQKALESILQAVCDFDDPNQTYIFANSTGHHNQTRDSENTSIMGNRSNRMGNIIGYKSFGENTTTTGFCLSGDRMGELFEKVYIPQKDNSDGEMK